MSKSDEQQTGKSQRLMTLALLNACAQYLLWGILLVFVFLSLGSSRRPIMPVTGDDPLFPLVSDMFSAPGLISPILSLALVPAIRSRRWQVVAIVATLLNAGLMLLVALLFDTVFFLPMVGYLVSVWLIGRVLVERKGV